MRRDGATETVHARISGLAFQLTRTGKSVRYRGDGFELAFDALDPAGTARGNANGTVDLTYYHIIRLIADGVHGSLNYVSTRAGTGTIAAV